VAAIDFDLDDTLVDSAPDLHAAANATLANEGLEPLSPATIRSYIGDGIDVLVARCLAASAKDPAKIAAASAHFRRHYAERDHRGTTIYPGAAEALARLKASGHRLAACTNKEESFALDILATTGFLASLDAVVGGDTTGRRKPDAAPLLACARLCGSQPNETLYIGDSEIDAETALAAGVDFILYEGGYRREPGRPIAHRAAFYVYPDLPGLITVLNGI
jgi:phosphoglycolate phosphatase